MPKLAKNKARDEQVQSELHGLGWQVMVVWECQIKLESDLRKRIERFLDEE